MNNIGLNMKTEHGHHILDDEDRAVRYGERSLFYEQLQYNLGLASGSSAHGLWAGHRAVLSHQRLRRHKLNAIYI